MSAFSDYLGSVNGVAVDVDGGYGATDLQIRLVKAGYQAAMEETRKKITELEDNYDDANSVYFLWRWLDEQVKKEVSK